MAGTERLLTDGETSVARIVETVGGGGANSACAAAALGAACDSSAKWAPTGWPSGCDRPWRGRASKRTLPAMHAAQTGTTVALGFDTGHRHFLSRLPNNESLALDDLDLAALDGCTHLLRADVWFSPAMLEGGNERLFAEARRRNITTSLDINYDPCWGTASADTIAHRKQMLRKVLPLVDIAHGNVRELCEFTDSPDLDAALMPVGSLGRATRGCAHGRARGRSLRPGAADGATARSRAAPGQLDGHR